MLIVREDDLSDQQSRDLIALHLAGMRANVPPGALFLDLPDMQQPGVTVWSAWDGSRIASIGVLKKLPDGTGEIKSMRTHPDFIGRSAGTCILTTIIDHAKARRMRRLSLETGSGPAFEAARVLYERFGFREDATFSGHDRTGFTHVLHLDLDGMRTPVLGSEENPFEEFRTKPTHDPADDALNRHVDNQEGIP